MSLPWACTIWSSLNIPLGFPLDLPGFLCSTFGLPLDVFLPIFYNHPFRSRFGSSQFRTMQRDLSPTTTWSADSFCSKGGEDEAALQVMKKRDIGIQLAAHLQGLQDDQQHPDLQHGGQQHDDQQHDGQQHDDSFGQTLYNDEHEEDNGDGIDYVYIPPAPEREDFPWEQKSRARSSSHDEPTVPTTSTTVPTSTDGDDITEYERRARIVRNRDPNLSAMFARFDQLRIARFDQLLTGRRW